MSDVPDIHDVLHWSNRTLVAEEITRRGFRVSKETLNRWVRQRKEVPAAVERIVFELFGITPDTQTTPPPWAEALEQKLVDKLDRNRQLIERLIPDEALRNADDLIGRLEELLRPGDEDPPEESGGSAPGEAETQVQADGSPPVRSHER